MPINTIDVYELKNRYDASPNLCLIDVREPDEWNVCHIPGAMHIPKDTLTNVIDGRVADKEQPIYLYCRGGVRSLVAANTLSHLGYKHVYSIDGGIMDWMQANFPVQSP